MINLSAQLPKEATASLDPPAGIEETCGISDFSMTSRCLGN
jgi:hypothetical protein